MFRITRRHALAAVGAALMVAGPLTATTFAQDTVRRGGELVASIDFQPKSLDPAFGDADTLDRIAYNALYDTLVYVDDAGVVQPKLAESWEYAEDGMSITMKLREGVTFHDGTPFNAEAVKFNIDRIANPDTRSNRIQDVLDIASVEVLSEYSVRFNLARKSAVALPSLAAEGGFMVSPTAAQASGEDFGRTPVGTGPFKFVDWPGAERLNLVKNENYWAKDAAGEQLPYLDKLTIRTVRQAAVASLELEAGTIHLASALPIRDAQRLSAAEGFEKLPALLLSQVMVALNTTAEPFNDKRVRQAVAHAFDREQLSASIGLGEGLVLPLFVAPAEFAYDQNLTAYGYDPEKSKSLLKEAGIDRLSMSLSIIQREPDVQIGQIMQAQAAAAGIDLNLEILDRQAWLDKVRVERKFDGAMLRAVFPKTDIDKTFTFYFGRGLVTNYSLQEDEFVFDSLDAARGELDQAKRKEIYSALSSHVLDESYFSFLFAFPSVDVVNTKVKNIKQDVNGVWFLEHAWLSE
jgi:peptide/nickel transport system substrate-binding protein